MVLIMVLYAVLVLILLSIILVDFLGLFQDGSKHKDKVLIVSLSILGFVGVILSSLVV